MDKNKQLVLYLGGLDCLCGATEEHWHPNPLRAEYAAEVPDLVVGLYIRELRRLNERVTELEREQIVSMIMTITA